MGHLNQEQRKASLSPGGIDLVIAGAGTGKTKTLVEKIRNILLTRFCLPENILVLTFSRKAAEEIKERAREVIGNDAIGIQWGTFHAFCLGFLKENSRFFIESFGFNTFPGIIPGDSERDLYSIIIRKRLHGLKGIPVDVAFGLVKKFHNLDSHIVKKLIKAEIYEEIAGITRSYIELKKEKNLMDYEDMINFTISLLNSNRALRSAALSRHRYILVDEFQDTSENNFKLIKLLHPETGGNLFVVGDDWQAIYGFRNARVDYIIKMKKYFPGVRIHRLKINYRSRREIVDVSSRLIKKNRFRTRKRLISWKGKGGSVVLYAVDGFQGECELIMEILSMESVNSSSIALLFRNNFQISNFLRETSEGPLIHNLSLMTIHASKGLEFDAVIVAGISDAIIPDRSADVEEERRLYYVALTRARERLYIISHKNEGDRLPRFGMELGITHCERG